MSLNLVSNCEDDPSQFPSFRNDDFSFSDDLFNVQDAHSNTGLLSPINFTFDPASISTQDAFLNEIKLATDNISEWTCLRWSLSSAQETRELMLFEKLLGTPGHSFRLIPRFTMSGNSVVDIGGVFRDSINRMFHGIYESDIFNSVGTNVGNKKTFRELSPVEVGYRKGKYFVFGKIFYWFIIIHRQIPYPMEINPTIVAYAIHGKIPRSILQQIDPSVNLFIEEILQYNSETTMDKVTEIVRDWLKIIGVPLDDFVYDLQTKNVSDVADNIATLATVNNSLQAFDHFRNGFNDQRGFESVQTCNIFAYLRFCPP